MHCGRENETISMSTSLRGRELKYIEATCCDSAGYVDLLARSWVEMLWSTPLLHFVHRRPPCEVVSWNSYAMYENDITYVDLLARSWVEIYSPDYLNGLNTSTSLRGRELKYCPNDEAVRARIVDLLARSWVEIQFKLTRSQSKAGRPPCEVVSWNTQKTVDANHFGSRPPCEVVSWNNGDLVIGKDCEMSTSLRGRELKY